MVSIVEIPANGHLVLVLGALNSSRISTGDEKPRTNVSARLAVPLHLCRPSVQHRRRPDCHNGVRWKHAFFDNDLVLVDTNIEWHIVRFGPASQRSEPQKWLLVSLGLQLTARILHKVCMPGMGWVAGLESVHSIGSMLNESFSKLSRSQTIGVQSVVVSDPFEELDFTTQKIWSSCHKHLNVRMVWIHPAEQTGDDFFLAEFVDFWVR
mmetsp:Transcript_14974/g.36665  ORF Transcript_14974/g.36665 Transcript_14974/m.36665 type:complete len:209 (+) Transcript_14974:1300-1926(+)